MRIRGTISPMKNVTASSASYEVMALPRNRIWRVVVLLFFAACFAVAQTSTSPWIALGPEGGDVRSLALDPHDSSRIFLGTSAGELYRSTDGGASWAHFAHLGVGNDYVL